MNEYLGGYPSCVFTTIMRSKPMNVIYISEAGAYRALANMTMKAGLNILEVKRNSKVFPVLKRGEMRGYGLVFCGRVVKEN